MEKKISKKIVFLTYAVSLGIGLVAFLLFKRFLLIPMCFFAPSIFFVFFSVISDRERECNTCL